MRESQQAIAPETYTRDYYESHCNGCAEFRETQGGIVPERLQFSFELAAISEGMDVLDVGCGRGEMLMRAARAGARAFGFDYASSAVDIAVEAINKRPNAIKILIHRGNALQIPYSENHFDRVLMLDVVEHMHPRELQQCLLEIRRVLRADGRLIIHTMPNTWYYRYGYPVYRLFQLIRGSRLPADPRDRWGFKEVHINEQNLLSLSRALRDAGFTSKVWLQPIHSYTEERNPLIRFVMRALVVIYPFRFIFCNDLVAIAVK